jgi:hypothetical protein
MSFGVGREGLDGFCDPLSDLCTVADAVLDQDPAGLTLPEKGRDLIRLRRQIDRLEAAFALRVQDAHRNGVGLEDGHQSTPTWISWKTGMPRPAVTKVLRHAEVAELLPETGQAWRDGTITATAVELIAAARVPGYDVELAAVESEFLDHARRGDHKSLKMLTQHFRACARADGSKPAPLDEFTVAFVGDRCTGRFNVTKSAGQAICEAMEKFTRPPAANDGTSLAVRQAEGLVRLCEIGLARGTDAEGARPVVSYLTHARTESDVTHPLTLGLFAGVIDPRARDQILCDSVIVPVATDRWGAILDQGRATKVWNRATRRALTARSPHCQWPGCEIPADWCDAHHFVHWEHGGATSLANGVHLCRRHHTFVHQNRDWTYTFDHQQFRVFRADGTEVHPDAWAGMDCAV